MFTMTLVLMTYKSLSAQVFNDDCSKAIRLPSTEKYCSEEAAFTNVGAQPDQAFPNTCVNLLWENGVWFSFTPRKPGVLISVLGQTIKDPKIVVFDVCGQYLQCSPGKNSKEDELLLANLTPGHTYFMMIESSRGGEGTFKICLDEFVPVPSAESDCRSAVVLCDKSSFKVESLIDAGEVTNEISKNDCIQEEFQSAWYKWTCDKSGTLTFTLTPNDYINRNTISDDLDFAVYELPGGLDDCGNKVLLRCMASGANGTNGVTNPLSTWIDCNGPTGLRQGDPDMVEFAGCQSGDNNFLKELDMISGKSYVLIVNNFSRKGRGFSIDFGGTGTFLGPVPDFEINANKAFECDKSVVITNNSMSPTDNIVSYNWNFGERAVPASGTGLGPFDVSYESFGDKFATLTVKSSRGCTVTKIVDFYVEPCCKDTSTLALDALVTDLKCYNIPDGSIIGQGISGAPGYMYSLNGGPFQPNPGFGNLTPGKYTLSVQDIKGCEVDLEVTVDQPEQILVTTGPDVEIELGGDTIIYFSYTPVKPGDQVIWSPPAEQIGPNTYKVSPGVTTTYTVTVVDSSGCTNSAEVQVRVIRNINVWAPNIFSPVNRDGNNDFFNVWTSRGAEQVELLEVYDRWGNLVYRGVDGVDFNRNDPGTGWDGRFKYGSNEAGSGRPVVSGVYTWRAQVRWKDKSVTQHAGDITVLAPANR